MNTSQATLLRFLFACEQRSFSAIATEHKTLFPSKDTCFKACCASVLLLEASCFPATSLRPCHATSTLLDRTLADGSHAWAHCRILVPSSSPSA